MPSVKPVCIKSAPRIRLVPASEEEATSAVLPPETREIPRIAYSDKQTIAQAVYLSGLFRPPALCSGLARCGRCRMRLIPPAGASLAAPTVAEQHCFSPEELHQGWRLACRQHPAPGLEVELPPGTLPFADSMTGTAAMPPPSKAVRRLARPRGSLLLAVDLGTTSLQWRLLALEDGASSPKTIGEDSAINPQMGAGSDVISRFAASLHPGGKTQLQNLTLAALRLLAEEAQTKARKADRPGALALLCLAGNPAMTAITLGLDTGGLASAPLSLPYRGGRYEALPGLPPIWTPPQLAPFVGGDISAGYAFLALSPGTPPTYPFLLADMGTNGEFLLALTPDSALVSSVALGPALEGIGLSHGTEARAGAITDMIVTPAGLEPVVLPYRRQSGGKNALDSLGRSVPTVTGITGAGYLALLDALLRFGGMDREGHFVPGSRLFPLERHAEYGEDRIRLPHGLALYATDVEEALKVKAGFSMGLSRLLDAAGLAPGALANVYLAGALGFHAKTAALENLGFFPPGMRNRITVVGNSSLAGASLLVASPAARDALVRWSTAAVSLDLASDASFAAGFSSRMRFSW